MADANDPGLLSAAQTSLLVDLYELTMSASYHHEGLDAPAVFELFVRRLPPNRDWLLAAGIGPALRLLREMRFGEAELSYLARRGFGDSFLERLSALRFTGDVDAMPEGTLAFADEPLLRVTAPRIEGQLVETLLLNQVNFQTMIATKAARVALAAGGGEPGGGERVIDFSPRRDHGIDAAMKVARSAAIAGCAGTSNVAAAMRYGLRPMGTMAHSYVLSFPSEREAFEAYLRCFPENSVLLVDTYDVEQGVRNAIAAARATGCPLRGVRIDSGDLEGLSRLARRLLDEARLRGRDHHRQRRPRGGADRAPGRGRRADRPLRRRHRPRDQPRLPDRQRRLQAGRRPLGGTWRGVRKLSAEKQTLPGAKQVWRRTEDGEMRGDLVAPEGEAAAGEPLLVPAMRGGEIVREESLEQMGERASAGLAALPARLRRAQTPEATEPYPVEISPALTAA